MNTIQNTTNGQDWKSATTAQTGYITAALIYWVFCYSMSRYSRGLEREFGKSVRR